MSKSSNFAKAKSLASEYNIPLVGTWVGTTAQHWATEVKRLRRVHFENLLNPVIARGLARINDFHDFFFSPDSTFDDLYNEIRPVMIANEVYRVNMYNGDRWVGVGGDIRFTTITKKNPYYTIYAILSIIADSEETDDYYLGGGDIPLQLQRIVTTNPPLANQRNSPSINCAIKAVMSELKKNDSQRNKYKIKNLEKLNKKYFKSGIGDTGFQELADKSYYHLIVKDKIKKIWREFKPSGNKQGKKLLMVAHNYHTDVYDSGDDTSDGEELDDLEPDCPRTDTVECTPLDLGIIVASPSLGNDATIKWFDSSDEVIQRARIYENNPNNTEGMPIISKGEMVAYITPKIIYKTKFHEWETFPDAFTSGGVGKSKFIQEHPEFKRGINSKVPFYKILMDSDQSGFYMRTAESKQTNTKYDMNHSYKSFESSGLFKGFPILEGIFKVDKNFKEFHATVNTHGKHGLLYIIFPTLTTDNLDKPIYYECSGWYPIEIVRDYFVKYGINPFVRSYAYASKTFTVDFSKWTNDQFRTFIGKCIAQSFDEVWRTKDYLEYERARYILQERISRISRDGDYWQIEYTSEKSPWNFPVVSSYVKHHQKVNLFRQYNKLISVGVVPVAICVDGIELTEPSGLFDIGKGEGQWKLEKVKASQSSQSSQSKGMPSVIARVVPTLKKYGTFEFKAEFILPRFLHISGAGGNGKTEQIIKLSKIYPGMCFMAPTHDAVKNIKDRATNQIQCDTYHRIFGIGCEDRFPRELFTHFVIDECSMLSVEDLNKIVGKLLPHQSLILAGDFWQLPTVFGDTIFDNWTGVASDVYKQFEIRELKENWRQKTDPEFFNLCQRLREPLSEAEAITIIDKLNTRVCATNLPDNTTVNDIHICGINVQVDKVNSKYKIEVGSKVICNQTCHDMEKKKVPNGSIGIVEAYSPKLFKVSWGATSSTFSCIGKTKSGKPRFIPAYGLTIHKAQGKTISRNVIINPTRLFSKNHLYVAVTRATAFDSIYLTDPLTLSVFRKTVNVIG